MRVGRKSSADAGSFLVILMALKMCLLHLVMQANLSRGTCLESISMVSFFDPTLEDALKNFFTVVTLRVFSLVFFSSNLENVRDWAPWLL